jgi:uncharacterized membrane protein YeaQ/YmgE (transglycosylase-associated protein family)
MKSFLKLVGVLEFPWITVLVCAFVGLLAGLLIAAILWWRTPGGQTVYLRLGVVGALTGGFLGLCYHVVVCVCRLELSS